jgi:hypothetical protein
VAVTGTTFLMMAIGTVWYSSMLFGNLLSKENADAHKENAKLKILLTFTAYFLMLLTLAYALSVAASLKMSVLSALAGIAVFALSLVGSVYILEHKSFRGYLVTAGFFIVFIIGGGLVLEYWPW